MFIATGESTTIHSPWIGEIQLDPQCELKFPVGMPGFEDHRRMMPVEIPSQRPLVYLQSLESPEVCFVALPVYVIDPAFQLRLSEEERSLLQLPANFEPAIGVDVLCLALLMPSGHTVEANLNAPVVINLHTQTGVQSIPADGIPASFQLSADNGWVALC